MVRTINLQSSAKTLAFIKIMNICTNKILTTILHENTVGIVGNQNGEIYFEIMNNTEYSNRHF